MPLLGLEPTIPVFERAKTFCSLDHAPTAIGVFICYSFKICFVCLSNDLIPGSSQVEILFIFIYL
jgi:hypothetical protein